MIDQETLKVQLKQLRLPTMASLVEAEAANAGKLKISYTQFLSRLVEAECLSRTDRSIAARTAKARFPFVRTLEGFDFSFQPCLSAAQIHELGNLSFLEKAENIIFVANPGRGKTHLSIGIGMKACLARKRVLFTTVGDLLNDLQAARVGGNLSRKLTELSRVDLLILDELGYDPLTKEQANLLFQVVAKRYERNSIILTTNKNFKEWDEALAGDAVVASAILDRLLHHSPIIPITGPSYRTKGKEEELLKRSGTKEKSKQATE